MITSFLRLMSLASIIVFAAESVAAAATGSITGRVQNVVTGQYLNQARVTLRGGDHVTFTDNFGTYRLVGVPAGPAVVEFFYTDLDPVVVNLIVPAGGVIERHVDLTSAQRYGRDATAVKLNAFVVASDKETDAQAIATNEQRFAPNLKNVLSTDALGDVLGGSVGEFLKFMPGLTADFDNADIAGVSVRGLGGAMTAITSDGAPATNIWTGATRTVDVRSMALNDISRIELSKVPTPANPADSLGGSVNLVSKSAFERSGRQLRWGVNVVGNHEALAFGRMPHSQRDQLEHTILPGANFDFTWPVTRDFGVVIAGTTTEIYNEQHFARTTWATTGTGGALAAASQTNPYLQSFLLIDGPRNISRNSFSAKADWRVMRHGVLSLGHVLNRSTTRIGALQLTFNAGANGTPTLANASPTPRPTPRGIPHFSAAPSVAPRSPTTAPRSWRIRRVITPTSRSATTMAAGGSSPVSAVPNRVSSVATGTAVFSTRPSPPTVVRSGSTSSTSRATTPAASRCSTPPTSPSTGAISRTTARPRRTWPTPTPSTSRAMAT